jgi:small conductance mechanosensitive channel
MFISFLLTLATTSGIINKLKGSSSSSSTTESSAIIDAPDVKPTADVTQNMNAIERWWHNINWDHIIGHLVNIAISLIVAFIIFGILYKIGRYLINKAYAKYAKYGNISTTRAKTIQKLVDNTFQYSAFFILVYTILWIIGVPVASLIAGAGFAGLAIGLGAQGFMNDLVTGFFIIVESQLDVGDHVKLMNLNIDGSVVAVGIRTTKIKAFDGALHYIPNRYITTITNLSRSDIRVSVDTRIKVDEDIEKITALITDETNKLTPQFTSLISKGPDVFGMVDLGGGNYAIRVTMYVVNGEQYKINEAFTAAYVKRLTDEGIEIPNTPLQASATK